MHYGQCPFTSLVCPRLNCTYSSKCTALNISSCFIPVGITALPLTNLNNPVVFARSFNHQIALLDSICQRFFNIYILTCLTSSNQLQTVPVIGSSNNNKIYILVIYNLSPVLHQLRGFFARLFLYLRSTLIKPLIINVAQ